MVAKPLYRGLVLTDLDHTMLGRGLEAGRSGELAEYLWETGIPVIPITAKTIKEIILLMDRIGLSEDRFLAAAENGAAIYATPGALPEPTGTVDIDSILLEYIELAEPLTLWKQEILKIMYQLDCNYLVVETSEEASKIVEFTGPMLEAMVERLYDLIVWSPDRICLEKLARKAAEAGFNALLGSKLLHIYRHRGKGGAAEALKELLKPYLSGPIVALGDSPIDWPMLDVADVAIVIPRFHGIPQVRLRPSYRIARKPAPEGWVESVESLLLSLF